MTLASCTRPAGWNRRLRSGLILLLPLCLLAFAPDAAAAAPRPNIILVMSDDQGWGDVGYNGNPVVRTPHLDAMAREALRLDRFYTGGTVCTPTRASCLTGRHPYRMGINWATVYPLPASEVTLAEALKSAGYRTGHFGKWHLGELSRDEAAATRTPEIRQAIYAPPWEHGFDVSFSNHGGPTYNPMYWGRDQSPGNRAIMNRPVAWGETDAIPGVRRSGLAFWTGPGQTDEQDLSGDSSKIIMDRALRFIERQTEARTPFLAVVWLFTPHSPVAAGPLHREPYRHLSLEAQHWYGCLTAMDEQIGRLRRHLRELGIADDTVVWFCSDNGPSWVLRELNSAGPFRGEKGLVYEGGVRVPGLLEWPARFREPRTVLAPLTTHDIYPTVLNWAGVPVARQPQPLDGLDVTPLLDGRLQERPEPIGFQSPVRQSLGRDWSKDPNHWRINPDPETHQLALTGNRFKIVSMDNGRTFALYDLLADPAESTDIAASHPDVVSAMRRRLLEWMRSCDESRAALAHPSIDASGSGVPAPWVVRRE
ncbi:MAG: sulfatase-like hydrolase/transferase [Opitutaceae bacterium]|nr:sulfatase-like hydrolase/transferase [Opitutaceae bacterium]